MIGRAYQSASFPRAAYLLAALAGALMVRLGVAGSEGNRSPMAGLVFALLLALILVPDSWRPARPTWRGIAAGVLGAAVLLAFPAWMRYAHGMSANALPMAGLVSWAPVVVAVAVAEEALLRGALFSAINDFAGSAAAVAVTTVAFALVHVPLYGWTALPLDLAVGLWLGALRVLTHGVTAPAVAHVLADLGAWWVA